MRRSRRRARAKLRRDMERLITKLVEEDVAQHIYACIGPAFEGMYDDYKRTEERRA